MITAYILNILVFEQKETALNNLNKIQCWINYHFWIILVGEYFFYLISFTMASLNGDKVVRSGFMIGKLITLTRDAAKYYIRARCA